MIYHQKLDDLRSMNRFLARSNVGLIIIIGLMIFLFIQFKNKHTVHIQPGLSNPATFTPGVVPPVNVFSFAQYIVQNLNLWVENGQQDYARQIEFLSPFITPRCKIELKADYERRSGRGELRERTRALMTIPGWVYTDSIVKAKSNRSWEVPLDFLLLETVQSVPMKRDALRWITRVELDTSNPEANPWGMVINCFVGGPKNLNREDLLEVYGIDVEELGE